MPSIHDKAVAVRQQGKVKLTSPLCQTKFETCFGTKGVLYIQRWIAIRRDTTAAVFWYCASVNLNRPGTNVWCGAIDITTHALDDIVPWVTTVAEQCNEQLQLDDIRVIGVTLEHLSNELQEFLPTLACEDRAVRQVIEGTE
jgi:hypothetical protein